MTGGPKSTAFLGLADLGLEDLGLEDLGLEDLGACWDADSRLVLPAAWPIINQASTGCVVASAFVTWRRALKDRKGRVRKRPKGVKGERAETIQTWKFAQPMRLAGARRNIP